MKTMFLIGIDAIGVWLSFHSSTKLAFAPIIAALISAAAAAASGIAGAVQQGQAADDEKKNSAANRAQQEKLAKMQIAAQQEQQAKDQRQAAMQQLSGVYGQQADMAYELAQRKMAANGDAMDSITRAYGGRG